MTKTLIGYARTSTADQIAGLEAQIRDLRKAGCENVNIFSEQTSSVASRTELRKLLDFIRKGDVLVVTRLDRLVRSMKDFFRIIDELKKKDVDLQVLDMNIDTSSPTGRLIFAVIGSIAEFERDIMLERQKEGILKAKKDGKYKGRKPISKDKADEVIKLARSGHGAMSISQAVGISRASVYRVIDRHVE